MAVANNRLRLLYVLQILMEESDENHPISAKKIMEELGKYDQKADRKTIYSDITMLEEYGIDLVRVNGGDVSGFYVASRDFELPELKLLVDAVQVSKFITGKKSEELIGKLSKLTNKYEAKKLKREVHINGRPKVANETIYYNVDYIHQAINEDRQICFKYTKLNMKKQEEIRDSGKEYLVSPWALTWDEQNYYLVAFDHKSESIRHYRVDRMKEVRLLDEKRVGKEAFADFDLVSYGMKTFGMYGGRDEIVTLTCHESMVGVILDRFGQDVMLIPDGDCFTVNLNISVSPQFFGWVTGLSGKVKIKAPESVRNEYKAYIAQILSAYEK